MPDGRGMTTAEAKVLAPPNAALRKDTARFHRWQCQALYTTQIWGKTWGGVTGYSDNEALTYALV